jgi:anti-repressor protein
MKELIKIQTIDNQQLVDARELHEFLEVQSKFADWIKNRIDKYRFTENQDYVTLSKNLENGGRTFEYGLTIDTAKELSMVENNDKGREARRYFIQKEKEALNPHGLYSPSKKELAQWVIESEEKIERLTLANDTKDKTIKALTPKAELMERVLDADEKIDIGQTAKILQLPFGRNILFRKLREKGVFFMNRNEPKQEYIDRGYFQLKEKYIERSDDKSFVVIKVLVTQKGLELIANLFNAPTVIKELALIQ